MGFICEEVLAGRISQDAQADAYELLLYSLALLTNAQLVYEWGAGKSTLALLRAVQRTGGKVISCDIESWKPDWMAKNTTQDSLANWEFCHMNSEKFFETIVQPADLIYIDGCHSYTCVLWEVTHFWNWLRPDGLMVLHDTRSFSGGVGVVFDQLAALGLEIVEIPNPDGIGIIHRRVTDPFQIELKLLKGDERGEH